VVVSRHHRTRGTSLRLDALFHSGRITTLDGDRPTAHALGVIAGRVVGLDDEVVGLPAARRHDLGGAAVVPGLHDAHQHLAARGEELRRCDLSPAAVPDLDALAAALARYAADLPADAWVLGVGFDDAKLGGLPTRALLDRAGGGRPVWVAHASHHAGVLSTEGFRRLGCDDPRDLPDVPGGVVGRDAAGEPTGFLAERALTPVFAAIRPSPFAAYVAAIGLGSRTALAEGLTSVTEPGVGGLLTGNGPSDLAAWQEARDRGLLGVRATLLPEASALHLLDGDAPDGPGSGLDLGLRTGFGDDHLRLGGVKLFADGALTARTAALREDYTDDPGNRGVFLEPPAHLHERILAAHRAGWQVATHAIGDAAIDVVLDAYEQAQARWPRPDPRHRIEHCGLADDDQVRRIARLGVIPVPQGRFLSELGDAYLAGVGPDRRALLYRQRAYLAAGIEVPGSSDCPVVAGAPLLGIQALVTRELPDGTVLSPDERLTPLEALRAFTVGSAYADHQEQRKGRLRRGMLADLVVLGDELTAVQPARIGAIEVVATVVGGEVRYGADRLASG
jgi:predicted amidohydrolase YtcJ